MKSKIPNFTIFVIGGENVDGKAHNVLIIHSSRTVLSLSCISVFDGDCLMSPGLKAHNSCPRIMGFIFPSWTSSPQSVSHQVLSFEKFLAS